MSKHFTAIIEPIEHDFQSEILYEELMNRGAKPLMLPFSLKFDNTDSIYLDNEIIRIREDLESVKAIYLRGLSVDVPLMLPPYLNRMEYSYWQAKYIRENMKVNLWLSLLKRLDNSDKLILNNINTYLEHYSKMQMFALLQKNHFPVPKTFATNDMDYLKKFLRKKKLIMKSSTGVGATILVGDEISDKGRELLQSPVLFQEYIEGSTIRVHTVGNKFVLALIIYSKDTDSRSDTGGFQYYEMNLEHIECIKQANSLLGIKFSAWDVIIDKKGRLYLLDCNPGPYIGWIGPAFTRIVMAAMADYMSAYAKTGSLDKAEESIKIRRPDIEKVLKFENDALLFINDSREKYKTHLNIRH